MVFCSGFQSSSFISSSTANAMLQAGGLDFCLIILQNLLDHWKKVSPEDVRITSF